MIKKLLILGMIVLSTHSYVQAQVPQAGDPTSGGTQLLSPPTTPTVVTDTLSYYYNKQRFKIADSTGAGFPFYKSAAATVTNITHMGSVFLNTDPLLMVDGLQARLAYDFKSNSMQIPVRLYLYNVDGNLMPTNIIDSITTAVGGPTGDTATTGHQVGGIFTNSLGPVSHNVPGNFAVMVRNLSLVSGDTVRIYRTGGIMPGYPGYGPQTKMGEGLGRIRFNGQFYSTKSFTHTSFGVGTDYEFCVAPIVTYTLFADHIAPYPVDDLNIPPDSVKCGAPLTFTNTSSSHWTNRFFNLNEFYRHFVPFSSGPPNGFPADSSISWYFDDEDLDDPFRRPNIVLANGATTATKMYDTSGCFTSCSMRARLTKMTAGGRGAGIRGNIQFSVCVSYLDCWTGMDENSALNQLKFFPNPTADGKVTITGLKGKNTICVYDMLGSLKATIVSQEESAVVDLLKEPNGIYMIKVANEQLQHRSFSIVHQKE